MNFGSRGCTESSLVWSQPTISSCFEAHGIQRFHSQEYHILPIKNEEIYGIISHLSFPMSFFSMWDTSVWGAICVIIQNFINLNLNAGIYESWLVFMSLQYTILVFTDDTGIYASYWYLHIILVVFTFDTGIYVWYWYFTHSAGI